ncbi:MAG TPA: zinc metalloprotease HtpX [Candidatus Bathyarchaeia archaeon]|nr:zinc metalloprotease HtpX [Candidatus Bathyarchaeia archaeon]
MNLWKLRLSMAGTLAIIIGLSTLVFTVILMFAGVFDLLTLGVIVVAFNIIQWLIAPYMVDAIYKVRALPENENPQLHQAVSSISQKSGVTKPKLMLAQIPLPNAFAYGSPLAGNRIAVTQGLLKNLDEGEVEAVIGHELGHLKHRDMQVMMAISFLPALCTYIGYSLMWSSMYRGNRRNEGGNSALIGIAFMAFAWVLNMFTLYLSRLREYYADRHSAGVVDGGAQKLSMGLAKIVKSTKSIRKPEQQKQNLAFKSLFISDPERANTDAAAINAMQASSKSDLVQEILSQKLTTEAKIAEAFSTHPNIIKRLRALQELSQNA